MKNVFRFFILTAFLNICLGIQQCTNKDEEIVGLRQKSIQIGCDFQNQFYTCMLVKKDSEDMTCSNQKCDLERVTYNGENNLCQFELSRLNVSGNSFG
jgi:hypothetical protein